jgi:hypothetical protein
MGDNIRRRARKFRRAVIDALGAACACCGETIRAALTIDHVHNDGGEERQRFEDMRDYYRHMLARGCPPGHYQVLCLNCHEAKNAYGKCPHQQQAENERANHVAA